MDPTAVGSVAAANQFGRVAGILFWGVLCVAGAYKCYVISRRPTTNTKCALGLLCFLAGYAVWSLMMAIVTLVGTGLTTAIILALGGGGADRWI